MIQTNYIFAQILRKAATQGIAFDGTRKSMKWFRDQAYNITKVDPQKMMETAGPFKKSPRITNSSIGSMYHFWYDPKHKTTLPYYDRFPLIFVLKCDNKGFLGINLHYIAPHLRAKLMDALWTTAGNHKMDSSTKLRINYQILKKAAKFRYFAPCVKRYLWTHVRSPFMYINPKEWDMALMLPSERFIKAGRFKVWRESFLSL